MSAKKSERWSPKRAFAKKIIDDEIKRLTVKRFANNGMLSLKYECRILKGKPLREALSETSKVWVKVRP